MPGKVTGVSFNGTHSYDDWGLKLKNVEIDLPEAKTVYVDVPGMNGSSITSTFSSGSAMML